MKRRLISVMLLLLILGFALLNILAPNHAVAMLRYGPAGVQTASPEKLHGWNKAKVLLTGVTNPRPESDAEPSCLADGCQVLTIANEAEQVRLEAWYCNLGADSPLVILFHGYAADKTATLDAAKVFMELGHSVLLVDFRGSGGSSESYTSIGMDEASDVASVASYSHEKLAHSKTILFGQSMGAVAILRAVDQYDVDPDAVILEAVFDTMLNTVGNRFKSAGLPTFPAAQLLVFWGGQYRGFNGFEHNPVEYAAALDCPALFFHGTNDPNARLAEGRRVFDAVPGPKTFVELPDTGHDGYLIRQRRKWLEAVKRFLG